MELENIREAVLAKWSREGFLDDIPGDTTKMNTAIVLENQYQHLQEAYGGTSTNEVAKYRKVVIPMVRRVFPNLITNDVVGVQPMLSPVGLAYALRRYYNDGSCNDTEAGYNTVDRSHSGTYATSAGERLGSDANLCPSGSGGDWGEMSIKIESKEIRAKTRKLKARFSVEVQQDLAAMHNVDVRQELTDLLSYEIGAEIDQEVLHILKQQAAYGGVFSWSYGSVGTASGSADGRWEQEKFRTLYTVLLKASNDIARDTRMGAGNFVIASSDVCAALETLPQFLLSQVAGTVDTTKTSVALVGTIGRFKVYRDMFALTNYAVVGYKGSGTNDAGVIYAPYVPVMFDEAKGQESFHTHLGVMTRYAVAENLFGAEKYYRFITVNMGDAMAAGASSGSDPTSEYQFTAAGTSSPSV